MAIVDTQSIVFQGQRVGSVRHWASSGRVSSIFLVGGGPDSTIDSAVYDSFFAEVGGNGRIAVALFDHEGSAEHFLPEYAAPLESRGACKVTPVCVRECESVDPTVFEDVDGGHTPLYWAGLSESAQAIGRAVASGVPYLGFSAGAMIAPQHAFIGGHTANGIVVCPQEWSEGLDELSVREGLGLVPFTVDVHAAQAGALGRGLAAVERGLVSKIVAIGEDTAAVVDPGLPELTRVIGTGRLCAIEHGAGSVSVSPTNGRGSQKNGSGHLETARPK